MSGVQLETCWAFNKLWNNKFYYKLHLVGISTECKVSFHFSWVTMSDPSPNAEDWGVDYGALGKTALRKFLLGKIWVCESGCLWILPKLHYAWNTFFCINPLKPELNSICYLLALLAHHFLHVGRIRIKSLTLRLLMSYIYGAPILDVSRSHTTTQHSR